MWPEVQCDGKSTKAALQTQAPENRGVCLRDLKPEQRGVHYPHSTTTERLDSILHPSAGHALCGEAPCLKSFRRVSFPKRVRPSV